MKHLTRGVAARYLENSSDDGVRTALAEPNFKLEQALLLEFKRGMEERTAPSNEEARELIAESAIEFQKVGDQIAPPAKMHQLNVNERRLASRLSRILSQLFYNAGAVKRSL